MFLLAMMRASPRLALFTYNHPFKCDAQTLATCALYRSALPKGAVSPRLPASVAYLLTTLAILFDNLLTRMNPFFTNKRSSLLRSSCSYGAQEWRQKRGLGRRDGNLDVSNPVTWE